jgi:transmembrane sensor
LNYVAWKTGIITFTDEPLPKALKFLSEYYHTEINIKDSSIVAYNFTGKYEKKSLQEMLEILEFTLIVKIEKVNGKYWLKKSNQ